MRPLLRIALAALVALLVGLLAAPPTAATLEARNRPRAVSGSAPVNASTPASTVAPAQTATTAPVATRWVRTARVSRQAPSVPPRPP